VDEYKELLIALVGDGAAVAIPDVRLTGELSRKWFVNTVSFGRPDAGMALTDLRACLDVLACREEVDASRIALVGLGGAGATALMAGALEPRLRTVAANNVGITYREGRWQPLIPGILGVGDLPRIAAAVAPRGLLLGGAGDHKFDFTSEAYSAQGAQAQVQTLSTELPQQRLAVMLLAALRAP
jgi:hypothetical protein